MTIGLRHNKIISRCELSRFCLTFECESGEKMIVKAYAKLNLTLDVLGKTDNGYHILDSVFQSVGLYDTLKIEKAEKSSVRCEGIDNNIALSAANEFFAKTRLKGGAQIKIEKGIPLLSGLGGGSSDAAAVIVALDHIYNTNLTGKELEEIAIKCGADVPFCLHGGTARIGGTGDKITLLSEISGLWTVLIKAGEKESTARMYAKLDERPFLPPVTEDFLKALNRGDIDSAFGKINNAFSSVAVLDEVIKAIKNERPMGVSLSGSGPTHFGIFKDEKAALSAAENLKKTGYPVYVAPFINRGNEIIE